MSLVEPTARPDARNDRGTADWLAIGQARLPVMSIDLELSQPVPELRNDEPVTPDEDAQGDGVVALALVRLHGRPVGVAVLGLPPGGLDASGVAHEVWRQTGPGIIAHFHGDGLPPPGALDPGGYPTAAEPACLRRRAEILLDCPPATVVVATRERPDRLRTCLESLSRLNYPRYDVVVVDNDPETDATANLIRSAFADRGVRYVREDRRGLAAAHNCGIQAATGDLMAFTDDDVVVDPDWLAALAEGFQLTDRVAAVTGLIHPAELRTRAQVLLEQHGSFGKGFLPRVFDLHEHRPADPLYPFTAGQFGSGANMAFDAEVLRSLGGFDPAMGVGTVARGGDDLVALFSVVASGHRLVYQPAAVVQHHHHDDMAALGRQAFGYGVGLGAYLANVMVHHPRMALKIAAHIPASLRSTMSLRSDRNLQRYETWPRELAHLERRGILLGPAAYAASSLRARRGPRPRAKT
jgi:GT2 family glycosyltransferase